MVKMWDYVKILSFYGVENVKIIIFADVIKVRNYE